MKMLSFSMFAVVICLLTMCRPMVITTIGADLFEEKLRQTPNPQLVDVRTFTEYADGYLPGAILIDIREPSFDSLVCQLKRDRPVFVYCRLGRRSLEAARVLEKNKFKIVYDLDGGIVSWKEKGKAVVTGND